MARTRRKSTRVLSGRHEHSLLAGLNDDETSLRFPPRVPKFSAIKLASVPLRARPRSLHVYLLPFHSHESCITGSPFPQAGPDAPNGRGIPLFLVRQLDRHPPVIEGKLSRFRESRVTKRVTRRPHGADDINGIKLR